MALSGAARDGAWARECASRGSDYGFGGEVGRCCDCVCDCLLAVMILLEARRHGNSMILCFSSWYEAVE
jgi:hypothetical protein